MEGAVRADADDCKTCGGSSGHHFGHCPELRGNHDSFADKIGIPEERRAGIDAETKRMVKETEFDAQKLPPTPNDLASNELLWLVAKTCHEVNRAFCREVLHDHSHLSWDEAPEWQRASTYKGVLMHFENPEATPEDSHASWLKQKRADGWVFGNRKDEKEKTHPSMLPYAQLHQHDRAKDHLFAAVCKSMFGG